MSVKNKDNWEISFLKVKPQFYVTWQPFLPTKQVKRVSILEKLNPHYSNWEVYVIQLEY